MPTVAFHTNAGPVSFQTKSKMASKTSAKTTKPAKKQLSARPDIKKKQKRVAKILDDKTVQDKLKKKISKKRDTAATKKVVKNKGSDSSHDAAQAKPKTKRQKKETDGSEGV